MELGHPLKVLQINLHHCQAASALLCKRLAGTESAIVLTQEPWVFRGDVRGLSRRSTVHRCVDKDNAPRACVLTSQDINAWMLPQFSNRDTVAVSTMIRYKNTARTVIFASVYHALRLRGAAA